MNMNVTSKIKSLLLNKNMVVVLSVFAGIIVLWYIYNNRINSVIKPKMVPVANRDILEKEKILSGDITLVEINTAYVKKANILTTAGAVTNKYVANGTSIKAGSPFYREQVVDKADLSERDLEDIPEGYTLYYLPVSFESTYANSIYPGDRIDLWIKLKNEYTENKWVYEPFIKSIEVMYVKDSTYKYNVFDGSGKRIPAYLVFAVLKDANNTYEDGFDAMLRAIERLNSVGANIDLYPVPRNKMYTDLQEETAYVNDRIKSIVKQYIRTY